MTHETPTPSEGLIQAVAVTAELCGRTFTPAAAAVFVGDLAGFPEAQVLGALRRCRMEVRGVLTVQDVISRMDDGRPSAAEAWAMVPRSEADSAVLTEEIAHAWGIAAPALDAGDRFAAQRAFAAAYDRAVAAARDRREPVKWFPSLGHDPEARIAVIERAAALGRLSARQAAAALPAPIVDTTAPRPVLALAHKLTTTGA
jgi:hypothetical protein